MPSLTLTVSAPDFAVLASAVGWAQGLGRDATPAEVKQYFVSDAIQVSKNYQNFIAQQAIVLPAPITPS